MASPAPKPNSEGPMIPNTLYVASMYVGAAAEKPLPPMTTPKNR